MSFPPVSVIIPTYNYANYIVEAIESILNQTYPNDKIEIIVVDDGSVDNTSAILQHYIDRNIIKYFFQENKGKANATFKAISLSTGKYIFNLDADDYFLLDKVLNSVQIFESDSEIVHVSSPALIIADGKNNEIEKIPENILESKLSGKELLLKFYQAKDLYGGGSTFSSRSDILKMIPIHEQVDMYIDEYLVLFVLNMGKSYFFKEPQSIWRIHNSNYTHSDLSTNNKRKRLYESSLGVWNTIRNENYPLEIKKLYELNHKTRQIFFHEVVNEKTFKDICSYFWFCFVKNRFSINILKNYSVFNRLIPGSIIRLIKKTLK